MAVILAPVVLRDRLPVKLPAEMLLVALVFIFAALFLGEMRSYYQRIWWWDTALHMSSGFLLGIFGFLLVYVLNESRNIGVFMRPRFVAFFAFLFAVAVGAGWEIFEFTMDRMFGLHMQKPEDGGRGGRRCSSASIASLRRRPARRLKILVRCRRWRRSAEFPVRVKCATLPWRTLQAAAEARDEVVSTE